MRKPALLRAAGAGEDEDRDGAGGRAWRGFFPVRGELTSGRPDLKEGVYFGDELGADDPRVKAGLPLHGANLFPDAVPELKPAVLASWPRRARGACGHGRRRAEPRARCGVFPARATRQSRHMLFRVFHYPPSDAGDGWGVGEHTDYGLLTLLAQDD